MKKSSVNSNFLIVANYASDYGYAWWLMENYWVEIATYAQRREAKTFLIYPEIRTISDKIKYSKIITVQLPYDFSTSKKRNNIKRFVRENNIKYVYLTDKEYLSVSHSLLRLWGVKVIIIHDHSPGERDVPKLFKRALKKLSHKINIFSADRYIGVSNFIYRRFLEVGCIPKDKCSYVLNGIEPYEMKFKIDDYAKKQFNLPEQAIIAVSTGRATVYKGVDFLIECAEEIINKKNVEFLYFIHCGDGNDFVEFRKMISEKNLEKRFILAGKRSDIREILLSCDIALHASIGEAFSLSILEYMSAGLACIIPDNCGNREAINDGQSGLLYETRNIADFIGILLKLYENRDYREYLGKNAREAIEKHFNIKRANKDLIRIIDYSIN